VRVRVFMPVYWAMVLLIKLEDDVMSKTKRSKRMSNNFKIVMTLVFVIALFSFASAQTWMVDNVMGSDQNDGVTLPLKTIAAAVASNNYYANGLPGTRGVYNIIITGAGNPPYIEGTLVLGPAPSQQTFIIQGQGMPTLQNTAFQVQDDWNITFSSIRFQGMPSYVSPAIQAVGGGTPPNTGSITVQQCEIIDYVKGIETLNTGCITTLTVDNCMILDSSGSGANMQIGIDTEVYTVVRQNTRIDGAGQYGVKLRVVQLPMGMGMAQHGLNFDTSSVYNTQMMDGIFVQGDNGIVAMPSQIMIINSIVSNTLTPGQYAVNIQDINTGGMAMIDALTCGSIIGGAGGVRLNHIEAAMVFNSRFVMGSAVPSIVGLDMTNSIGGRFTNNRFVSNYCGLKIEKSSNIETSKNSYSSNRVGVNYIDAVRILSSNDIICSNNVGFIDDSLSRSNEFYTLTVSENSYGYAMMINGDRYIVRDSLFSKNGNSMPATGDMRIAKLNHSITHNTFNGCGISSYNLFVSNISSPAGAYINNNTFMSNLQAAIVFRSGGSGRGIAMVENNYFKDNSGGCIGVQMPIPAGAITVSIKNNVFDAAAPSQNVVDNTGNAATDVFVDYNGIYNSGTLLVNATDGGHNTTMTAPGVENTGGVIRFKAASWNAGEPESPGAISTHPGIATFTVIPGTFITNKVTTYTCRFKLADEMTNRKTGFTNDCAITMTFLSGTGTAGWGIVSENLEGNLSTGISGLPNSVVINSVSAGSRRTITGDTVWEIVLSNMQNPAAIITNTVSLIIRNGNNDIEYSTLGSLGTIMEPALPPSPPSDFTLLSITPATNGFMATWTDSTNEDGYHAIWSNTATGVVNSGSLPANTTNGGPNDLATNTLYITWIYATNAYGHSSTNVTNVRTLLPPAAVPSGLNELNITSTSATLEWNAAYAAYGYYIKVSNSTAGTVHTPWTAVSATNYPLTGLSPLSTYTWWVYSSNTVGNSLAAQDSFSTLGNIPGPFSIISVTVTTNGFNAVWSDCANESAYIEFWSNTITGAVNQQPLFTNITNAGPTNGLTTNTLYAVWVYATNAYGHSSSQVTNVRTLLPLPESPASLDSISATSNSLTITWSPLYAAYQYRVGYTNVTAGGPSVFGPLTTATQYTFTGLSPDTEYGAGFYGTNTRGMGGSTGGNIRTWKLSPTDPVWLSPTAITTNSFVLNWADSLYETNYHLVVTNTATAGMFPVVAVNLSSNTVTYAVTGLTTNTVYRALLYAENGTGQSTTVVTNVRTLALLPPSDFSIKSMTAETNGFEMVWTDSTNESGYVAVVSNTVTGSNSYGFLPADMTNGGPYDLTTNTLYIVKIYATNAYGHSSTNVTNVRTLVPPPYDPEFIAVTGIANDGFTVGWYDSYHEYNYNFVLSNVRTGVIASNVWLPANTTNKTLSGLITNTSYTVRVYATNSAGTTATITTNAKTLLPYPTQPTGLSITGISETGFTVNWTDSDNEYFYQYTLSNASTGAASTTGLPQNTTARVETGLDPNTTYWVKIMAVNDRGSSALSTASAQTLLPYPTDPTWLPTTGISTNSFTVNWTDSTNEQAYVLFISNTANGLSSNIALPANTVTYTAVPLMTNTLHIVRLFATNTRGVSAVISQSVTTLQPNSPPSPPVWQATTSLSTNSFIVNWSDAGLETGYILTLTNQSTGAEVTRATLAADTVSHTCVMLTTNTAYTVTLTATNDAGWTTITETVTTLLPYPESPTSLDSTSVTSNSLTITWSPLYAAYQYRVGYTNITAGGPVVYGPLTTATQYTFTGLSPDTEYGTGFYGTNDRGMGGNTGTNVRTLKPYPTDPSWLAVTGLQTNAFTVNWSDSSYETNYHLTVSNTVSGTVILNIDLASNTTTHTVTGLTTNTLYVAKLYAENTTGQSATIAQNITTLAANNPPSAPAWSTIIVDTNTIALTWIDAGLEDGYTLTVSNSGSEVTNQTLAANTTSSTINNLTPNTTYTITLTATNANGRSSIRTNVLTAPSIPAEPVFADTAISNSVTSTSFDLSWAAVTGADGYRVRINSGTPIQDTSLGASTLTLSVTGLSVNTSYTCRIYASNVSGHSSEDQIVVRTVYDPADMPTWAATTGITASAFVLHWNDVNNESGYNLTVYRAATMAVVHASKPAANVTAQALSGLSADTAYIAVLYATNGDGVSNPTTNNVRTAAPPAETTVTNTGSIADVEYGPTKPNLNDANPVLYFSKLSLDMKIQIFTPGGALVKEVTIKESDLTEVLYELPLKNEDGEIIAEGTYFVRMIDKDGNDEVFIIQPGRE